MMWIGEGVAPYVAPLWPAGHLPHTGGDYTAAMPRQSESGQVFDDTLISPLVGEMAGRPEGGAKERKRGRSAI